MTTEVWLLLAHSEDLQKIAIGIYDPCMDSELPSMAEVDAMGH